MGGVSRAVIRSFKRSRSLRPPYGQKGKMKMGSINAIFLRSPPDLVPLRWTSDSDLLGRMISPGPDLARLDLDLAQVMVSSLHLVAFRLNVFFVGTLYGGSRDPLRLILALSVPLLSPTSGVHPTFFSSSLLGSTMVVLWFLSFWFASQPDFRNRRVAYRMWS
ncbi:hypothetical protein GGR53DRAFT_430166 [Hypoxylon sp. FL1150]|nr:hypothetical protein GGR53DRAFT_430166 [Hypoxylon sp. FL1150]